MTRSASLRWKYLMCNWYNIKQKVNNISRDSPPGTNTVATAEVVDIVLTTQSTHTCCMTVSWNRKLILTHFGLKTPKVTISIYCSVQCCSEEHICQFHIAESEWCVSCSCPTHLTTSMFVPLIIDVTRDWPPDISDPDAYLTRVPGASVL